MKGLLLGVIIASGILSGGCSNGTDTTTIKVNNVEDVLVRDLLDYVDNDYIQEEFALLSDENVQSIDVGDVVKCRVTYDSVRRDDNGNVIDRNEFNNIDNITIQYDINFKENTITIANIYLVKTNKNIGETNAEYFNDEKEVLKTIKTLKGYFGVYGDAKEAEQRFKEDFEQDGQNLKDDFDAITEYNQNFKDNMNNQGVN